MNSVNSKIAKIFTSAGFQAFALVAVGAFAFTTAMTVRPADALAWEVDLSRRQVDFDRRARCSCPFTGRKTRDEGDGGRRGRNTAGRSRGDQPCAALRIHGAGRRKGKVAHVGLLVRG